MRWILFIVLLAYGCTSPGTGGCPEIYDPVCGTDGETYANICFADLAGVEVQAEGECSGCTDSDNGKDIFQKGILSSGEEDSCYDANTLTEYYCGPDARQEVVSCPEDYSCSDGACIPLCKDNDKEDIFVKGTVVIGNQTYSDSCISVKKVREFVCDSGVLKNISKDCPEDYLCSEGACSDAPCTDTDGFNIFKQGTVSFNNSQYKDSCTSEKAGIEYRCSEGQLDEFVPFSCPDGFHCIDGFCQAACDDLDGGLDFYTRGSVIYGNEVYTDMCENFLQLREYHCTEGGYSMVIHECPKEYTCNNGRCLADFCQDPDGKDIYVSGTTTKGTTANQDYCVANSTVREYFCTGDTIHSLDFACPAGYLCTNGSCGEKSFCNDTDGGINVFEKGKVTSSKATPGVDFCVNTEEINEYYCSSGLIALTTLSCGKGYSCQNGSCIESCEETDNGKDFSVAGTTYLGNKSQTDHCSENTVVEYYCGGDFILSEVQECSAGQSCENGVCTSQCTDTDGNNPYVKGSVTYGAEKYDDYCQSLGSKNGVEYMCTDEAPEESAFTCAAGFSCSNGACNPVCEDSDGTDKFTKGTVYLGNQSSTDECSDQSSGTEYICSNGQISEVSFECFTTHECSEGRCIPKAG